MRSWTVKEMLGEFPCQRYTEKRIRTLWGRHRTLNINDILKLRIPAADKIWVAGRRDALDRKDVVALMRKIVDRLEVKIMRRSRSTLMQVCSRKWRAGETPTPVNILTAMGYAREKAHFALRAMLAFSRMPDPLYPLYWMLLRDVYQYAAGAFGTTEKLRAEEFRRQVDDLRAVLKVGKRKK